MEGGALKHLDTRYDRSVMGYIEPPADDDDADEFAQCEDCILWTGPDRERCGVHGAKLQITAEHTCNYYMHGHAPAFLRAALWHLARLITILKPSQSGLVHRQVRCENCRFFDTTGEPHVHCDLYTQLNLQYPRLFHLDRYVKPKACCNFQNPGKHNPGVFKPFGPLSHGNEHWPRVTAGASED